VTGHRVADLLAGRHVRLVDSRERASTFKSRKVDLRKQAYGPDMDDPLYALAVPTRGDVDYPADVTAGKRPNG
jgi:fatty-acyl-CoA synthase